MVRLWKGLGWQAPESVLVDPASGEGFLSILEEGETLETHSGQGFWAYGWPASGQNARQDMLTGNQDWKADTHETLLMAKLAEADVLEVFDVDPGHQVHSCVALLHQAKKMEFQAHKVR